MTSYCSHVYLLIHCTGSCTHNEWVCVCVCVFVCTHVITESIKWKIMKHDLVWNIILHSCCVLPIIFPFNHAWKIISFQILQIVQMDNADYSFRQFDTCFVSEQLLMAFCCCHFITAHLFSVQSKIFWCLK